MKLRKYWAVGGVHAGGAPPKSATEGGSLSREGVSVQGGDICPERGFSAKVSNPEFRVTITLNRLIGSHKANFGEYFRLWRQLIRSN